MNMKARTGFTFTNYNAHEMLAAIRYAERIYYDKKRNGIKLWTERWPLIFLECIRAEVSGNVCG